VNSFLNRKNLLLVTLGAGLIYFIYIVRAVLMPFMVGFFIAYCVKNVVAKFEERFSRKLIAIVILMLFFAIIIASLLFLVPVIYQQVTDIVRQFINFAETFDVVDFYNRFAHVFKVLRVETADELQIYMKNVLISLMKRSSDITNLILNSSTQTFSLLFKIFLIPIITYYFIADWNKVMKSIFRLVPDDYKTNVVNLVGKINIMMHHYIVGQILVTLIISSIYTILLLIIKFDFAIMLGITAGCLTLLPYVGSVAGFVMAFFLILFKYGFVLSRIISVFCVFGIGQFLEGNFITPNIIGRRIEVHPLWVIFSVLAGGALYGFWGMLLSLPTTAIIGIIIRYAVENRVKQKRLKRKGTWF
jgi:predicted PurR-regulated permease PerM